MTWQHIDTAPKDGAIILVYPATWSKMTASPACWDDDRYAKNPRPYWNRLDATRTRDSRDSPPSHWMPMPPPPEIPE